MASADAWESICALGLLSTEEITKHLKLPEAERGAILSQHRQVSSRHGTFTIRDQRPIDAKLARVLDDGTTPREWFELLNSKVFLWTRKSKVGDKDRLFRFLRTYSDQQLVLEFDSFRFLHAYASQISLCHINSGATRSIDHKRGRYSFVPFAEYEWSTSNEVAEVTVPKKVSCVRAFLNRASLFRGRNEIAVLFERDMRGR